jgi:regulator of protease activity HflC (stomatin/prohibitin superfamily)
MTLEAILTNRNQLNEDILADLQNVAGGYGVEILRADVKDIIFPGNLQDIMNRVLAAERLSEAQLVEARTKSEKESIDARTKAETDRIAAQARAEVVQLAAEAEAQAVRIRTEAEVEALRVRTENANSYARHPALLRLQELESLATLSRNAQARIYIGFDKHAEPGRAE